MFPYYFKICPYLSLLITSAPKNIKFSTVFELGFIFIALLVWYSEKLDTFYTWSQSYSSLGFFKTQGSYDVYILNNCFISCKENMFNMQYWSSCMCLLKQFPLMYIRFKNCLHGLYVTLTENIAKKLQSLHRKQNNIDDWPSLKSLVSCVSSSKFFLKNHKTTYRRTPF